MHSGIETTVPDKSIFYFGYMLGSASWSKLVQRYPTHVGKFISGAVTIWSAIILLTRKIRSIG